jgi:hypothetical protein
MKKLFYILIGCAVAFTACKKDYEAVPVEQRTIEYIFSKTDSNGTAAREFLNAVYASLIGGYNRVGGDYLDAATDDAVSSASGSPDVLKLATGGYTSSAFPGSENKWQTCYTSIRRAGIFINNIDVVPIKEKLPNGFSAKVALKAEARFLRALNYFELLKRYGGVTLMGDSIRGLDDNLELPRNSFAQCVDYIASECDAIKDSLRTNPIADPANYSQVATKGAALALKARVLLYAASPLYNNNDNKDPLVGYTNFDATRWDKAAKAAKDIMDLNVFALNNDFKGVFFSQTNSEVIFFQSGGNNHDIEDKNGPVGYPSAIAAGRTSPTQELVDAFPMKSGLAITSDASGYNPDKPYDNRDPRLAATVLCNGAMWLGSPLETFVGGKNRPGGTIQQTITGYYARKFMGNFENAAAYGGVNHDFLYFRYAEVLLNYAEAENEAAGPVSAVFDQIKALRLRAGIDAGSDGNYGLDPAMTKEQMRTVIQNERRVELAFEEHRYWDVRRWKIATSVCNRTLHGMTIQKYSSGSLVYQVTPVQAITFTDKRYFYPIPYDETVKNDNMKQNPGWGL